MFFVTLYGLSLWHRCQANYCKKCSIELILFNLGKRQKYKMGKLNWGPDSEYDNCQVFTTVPGMVQYLVQYCSIFSFMNS